MSLQSPHLQKCSSDPHLTFTVYLAKGCRWSRTINDSPNPWNVFFVKEDIENICENARPCKLNSRELKQNIYQFECKILTDDTNIVSVFIEHHLTNHLKGSITCHIPMPLKSDTSCISSMGYFTGCSQTYCARRNRSLNSQTIAVAIQNSKRLINIKINNQFYPGVWGQLYQ